MTNFKDLDFLVESLRKVDTGKNHILITGNIKVGKSTLLKAFIKKYYKNSKIDGIMTELVITDKFRIELFRYGTEERFVIGERESELFIENSCSPEEQEKLAQSFSDNASRKAKGSGMGLFVVKSLLEHEKLPYRFEMKENRLTFFIAFPKVGKD